MNGTLDLAHDRIDAKLLVTLPLTNNLTLAALIVGGPAVGGAVFVVDKLLGDRVSRFASVQYSVKGPGRIRRSASTSHSRSPAERRPVPRRGAFVRKEETMSIAVIQMVSQDDVTANLAAARRLLEQAAEGGARLAVLPENFAAMGRRDLAELGRAEARGTGLSCRG